MKNEDVKKFLPHRDPFLFIDKVVEISNEIIIAERYISPKETFFKGHFPNFPIMPGVLILEAMAQSCGLLGAHIMNKEHTKESVYLLCGVDKVRFKKMIRPGDSLVFESKVLTSKRGIWKFSSKAFKEMQLVCSAEILCADRNLNE